MARWPWNTVRGWKVSSLANGNILIEPDYISPFKGPKEGGGPGLFTRLRLADWIAGRLVKRRAAVRVTERQADSAKTITSD